MRASSVCGWVHAIAASLQGAAKAAAALSKRSLLPVSLALAVFRSGYSLLCVCIADSVALKFKGVRHKKNAFDDVEKKKWWGKP